MHRRLALLVLVVSAAAGRAQADGWDQYHLAFRALAEGRAAKARGLLDELIRAQPDHPAARRAAAVLAARAEPPPPVSGLGGAERPTGVARAELTLFQTVHGAGIGMEVCILVGCRGSARATAGSVMLGGGAGLGLALLATRGGITAGHVGMLDTGTLWGFWNSLAILNLATDDVTDNQAAGAFLLGQGVGMGVGELVWRTRAPNAGQVSLAMTVGLWSGLITLFAHGIGQFEGDENTLWVTTLVTSDLGFLAGYLIGDRIPMSRGRTLLINSGGVLGMLVGMALGVGSDSAPAFFGLAIGGSVAGLATATWATHRWDPKLPAANISVAPQPGGAMLTVVGSW